MNVAIHPVRWGAYMRRLFILLASLIFFACLENNPLSDDSPASTTVKPRFNLVRDTTFYSLPCYVHFMFQVREYDDHGVPTMEMDDFVLKEDDLPLSPSESAVQFRKRQALNYTIKTVLMLDNSASVKENLPVIKAAAKILIEKLDAHQEVALYSFSDHPTLMLDFTHDENALRDAIDRLQPGPQTTDLYGAVIIGTYQWQDVRSADAIDQGFLVLLTDGRDTQGRWTLQQALDARKDKRVFAVGLGKEIDPVVLGKVANQGFTHLDNYSELPARFDQIQEEILDWANSFYWIVYQSPKRGNKEHLLKLIMLTPGEKAPNDSITVPYNSAFFNSLPSAGFGRQYVHR